MGNVYYPEYLHLEKILNSQELVSEKKGHPAHDEMLFIVIHQTYELWFKEILFELSSIEKFFQSPYLAPQNLHTANSRLIRVIEILKVLSSQIKIMETMTALDFMEFRDDLVPASGFQSLQFRLLEATLGLKSKYRMKIEKQFFNSRLSPEHLKIFEARENQPSLLELVQTWLERMPFSEFKTFNFWDHYQKIVSEMLVRDHDLIQKNMTLGPEQKAFELQNLKMTENTFSFLFDQEKYQKLMEEGKARLTLKAKKNALFIYLYREHPLLTPAYDFLNHLVEIDELITTWRYQHAMMAQRLLGTKIGTGGSSGQDYLKKAAENNRIFIDLFDLATFLIPRAKRPELPRDLIEHLSFRFE
jgi:tryptophan 2,3-dioxygenase